jgi:hypothetical protein
MIEIKPFKADDLHIICKDALDETAHDLNCFEVQVFGVRHEQGKCSFTGWLDGKPLGCLGIDTVRPGVGHMWSVLHKDVKNHLLESMKTVKRMLTVIEDTYGFNRLRSESRIGFKGSQRFLEFLGFERGRRTIMNGTHFYYRRDLCHQ